MRIRFYIALAVGLALTSGVARAQVVGTAAGFQTIDMDAYSRGLAGATVALQGYPGAMSVNPATFGRTRTMQFSGNVTLSDGLTFSTPWLPQSAPDLSVRDVAFDVHRRRWAFGYRFKKLDYGHDTDARLPVSLGRDRSHKVALSYRRTHDLTLGAAVNFISVDRRQRGAGSQQAQRKASSVSLDLGMLYRRSFDTPHVRLLPSFGSALTDFGRVLDYEGVDGRDALTMTLRTGISLRAETRRSFLLRPLVMVGLHGNVSKILASGTTGDDGMYHPDGPFAALVHGWRTIEVNAGTPDDPELRRLNAFDQLMRQGAVEVSLLRILFVRAGVFHEHRSNGGRHYTTRGWGLDLYYVELDHSWIAEPGDGAVFEGTAFWRITARVPLRRSNDNFWRPLKRLLRR